MKRIKEYFDLFWTFFKIGLITFGGGYVMLGIIESQLTEKKKWITKDEMLDLLAIAESTPGPFSINAATFIGYKRAKVIGSFLATLGVVVPSMIIIIGISIFLQSFADNVYISGFLRGIQAGIGVLIFQASYQLSKPVQKTYFNIALFFIAFIISFFTNFSIIYLMMILILFGVSLHYAKKVMTK